MLPPPLSEPSPPSVTMMLLATFVGAACWLCTDEFEDEDDADEEEDDVEDDEDEDDEVEDDEDEQDDDECISEQDGQVGRVASDGKTEPGFAAVPATDGVVGVMLLPALNG